MSEATPASSARFDTLWNAVFAQSAELVFALDGRRRVLAVSEGFLRRFGSSVADVVGHVCTDVAHEGGVVPDGCPMQALILDGEQHAAEVHSDTLEGDFFVRVTPVLDDAGELEFAIHSLVDITERRLLEEELDDERLRYKLLVENSGEAILLTQPDGVILSANPEACRLFGRSEEEIRAIGRAGIVDPADSRLASALEEREQTSRATRELRLLRSDGTSFSAAVTSRIYTDHDGMLRTAIVIHDLTDRKQAEAANARLAAIVESSDDAILSKDLDGTILTWNRGAERLYGYTAEEVLGKSIRLLAPPDSEDQGMTLLGLIRRGVAVRRTETVRVRKDGSLIDVLLSVSPIRDAAGVVVGASTIAHDITARKRAERLMGATSEILAIIAGPRSVQETADGIVDALKRTTGLDAVGLRLQQGEDFPFLAAAGYSEEFLSAENDLVARYPDGGVCRDEDGSVCLECTCGIVVTGATDPADPLFTPGGSCWTNDSLPRRAPPAEDLRLNPRDRCVHDGYSSVALIPLRAGEQILGLLHLADHRRGRFSPESIRFFEGLGASIGVALRHKQAEAEIRRLNAELERRIATRTAQLEVTNRELEAFAYSVSHDLRAPLRAIDGFSAVLAEDAGARLTALEALHLERIRRAAQRMGELIDDLLGLSRAASKDLALKSVDVSRLAETVLGELREAQPQRRVETVVAPLMRAEADITLLRMILANLLENAWKFTSKHAQARIEVGVHEADGERAFFVRDDGAGFDPAHASKLFGAFQRMHAPREFEGTGIGLATVQRLVARHGGRVWAEAEVEKGATFYFTLPGPGA